MSLFGDVEPSEPRPGDVEPSESSSGSLRGSRIYEALTRTDPSNQNGNIFQSLGSNGELLGLPSYGALYHRRDVVNVSKFYPSLPPGEEIHERTTDGRLIRVDHNARTTEWKSRPSRTEKRVGKYSQGVATPPVGVKVKVHGDKDYQNIVLRGLTEEIAAADRMVRRYMRRIRADFESTLSKAKGPPPILKVPIIQGETNRKEEKPPTYGELYMRRDIENVSHNYVKKPPGQEIHKRKTDGRLLYVNHNDRTTRWHTGRWENTDDPWSIREAQIGSAEKEDSPPSYQELYHTQDIMHVSRRYGLPLPRSQEICKRISDGRLMLADHNAKTVAWISLEELDLYREEASQMPSKSSGKYRWRKYIPTPQNHDLPTPRTYNPRKYTVAQLSNSNLTSGLPSELPSSPNQDLFDSSILISPMAPDKSDGGPAVGDGPMSNLFVADLRKQLPTKVDRSIDSEDLVQRLEDYGVKLGNDAVPAKKNVSGSVFDLFHPSLAEENVSTSRVASPSVIHHSNQFKSPDINHQVYRGVPFRGKIPATEEVSKSRSEPFHSGDPQSSMADEANIREQRAQNFITELGRDRSDRSDSSVTVHIIPGELVRAGRLDPKGYRGFVEYGITPKNSPFNTPRKTDSQINEVMAKQESSNHYSDTGVSSQDSLYIDDRASSSTSSISMINDSFTTDKTHSISNNLFRSPSTLSSSSTIDKIPPISNSPFTSPSTPLNGSERNIIPAKQTPMHLAEFFTSEAPRKAYTDKEFLIIAQLLKFNGREAWGEVPRIYTVLRIIGQLDIIGSFIDQGITDIWFPFTSATLPKALSISSHASFLETQAAVLTKGLDLEKDERKTHAHFGRDEELPFKLGDALGAGAYSQVRKIVSISSKREYALKRFRRTGLRKEAAIKSFKGELKILKRIHHQHCVELIASYTDSKWIGLIMSPVADCDLKAFYNIVAKNESHRVILRTFYGCLSAAMTYLHDSKVRHRDIKPENILVKGDRVYFTDFGISLDWESLSRSTTTEDSAKTPLYCSPEVAQFKARNSSSDIWSLGCVFLEMATVLSGREIEEMQRYFKNNNDNYRFHTNINIIPNWSETLRKDLSPEDGQALQWVASMLRPDPTERPAAGALFESILRSQNGMESNSFCGTCCEPDASSDDGASDGELWAEDHESTHNTSEYQNASLTVKAPALKSLDESFLRFQIPTHATSKDSGTIAVAEDPIVVHDAGKPGFVSAEKLHIRVLGINYIE